MDILPDFQPVLLKNRNLIYPRITKYLDSLKKFPPFSSLSARYSSLVDFNYELISNYPRRQGKYLRPTLVVLTAQSMGVPLEKTLLTAAAMQTSEDWILNHDDIEDNSLLRRGAPTLHRLYSNNLAINAGDGLHVLMWKMLIDNNNRQIMEEFYSILSRTVLGQTIEIKWTEANKSDLTDEDVFLISESKTGYYTIAGPMRLGAILAGATADQLQKIYQFGLVLGRAFQITDDLLDLTSDFNGQKQCCNDLYEGKRTIMLVHLLNHLNPADKSKLLAILSQPRDHKTVIDIKWILDRMNHCGSIDYGRQLSKKFAQQARQIFETDLQFLKLQPYRDQLSSGIDFIVNRDH